MESSIEASQPAGLSKPKSTLALKPRLAPKPFSLQQNTTIRSIHAPKAVTSKTTTQGGKSDATAVSRPPFPTPAPRPTTSVGASVDALSKDQPKETKAKPRGEDTPDAPGGKSDAVSKPAPPKETPKPCQKDDAVQRNHKASNDRVTNPEQKDEKKKEEETSVNQKLEESGSDAPSAANPKETKAKPRGEDTPDARGGKSDAVSKSAPPKETPKPCQKDDGVLTNHKESNDLVTNPEQKDEKKKEEETSVNQKLEASGSDAPSVAKRSRNRLSMELTSMFESGGLSLPPQAEPRTTISAPGPKEAANKPSDAQQSQTKPEPSNKASEEGGLTEDYSGGSSIKRRISRLFDSSSRPEVVTKREEPEVMNGAGGVKARIKNWATETSSEGPKTEKKPQVGPQARSKSSEPTPPPASEEMPKMPPVEPPTPQTSSVQAVDLPSKVSPQPTETPLETSTLAEDESSESPSETSGAHMQNESTEADVQLRSRSHASSDEGAASEGAEPALKRDKVRSRSVRFGVVERDDGGPPLVLGSESDSSGEEEENASEDEAKEDVPVSVPVYRRVGLFQKKKDDEAHEQEAERLKHLEFERKRRAEEAEQARLALEEERKRKEEEGEREMARQREEEERRRLQEEEEEERQRKEEQERRKLEEEKESLRREEIERERQMELMRQREEEEEERERAKQKEERLKLEEERKRKEEEEEARQREEEERRRLQEEMERQRKEEWERERLEEEERERQTEVKLQRQREEERAKQKEERLKLEEERKRREEEEEARQREAEQARHALEEERKRKEEEEARQREEEERRRLQEEMERQWERERLEEEERERERLREEEMERERHMEAVLQRQREEERAKQKEERLKQEQEERERERVKEEEERNEERLREERGRREERSAEEHEEHRLEGKLREEEMNKEKEREEEWEKAWVSKTERLGGGEERGREEETVERMRQMEMEKEREEEVRELQELERKMQEELERKHQQDLEEKRSMGEERGSEGLANKEEEGTVDEANLISFDSEEVSPKTPQPTPPPSATADKPTGGDVEVDYEDFSVRKSLIEVDFDDFSVKPKRRGSQARAETGPPVVPSWSADPAGEEEVEVLVDVDVSPRVKVQEPPLLVQERQGEEDQLVSAEVEEEEEERVKEEEEEIKEDEVEEAQVNSYGTGGEDKDTDALIDTEPDQQEEACEETSETDSPQPVPDQVPEVSSEDVDATDSHRDAELAPFPESATPLLDTSAQRSKADLGKRRIRTRPARSFRAGSSPRKSPDWRARDSSEDTEASSKQRESDSEEEQPKPKIVCSPPPTSQRVPIFPGLNPAALIAQIKRRTGGGGHGGGGEETEEEESREEKESLNEEVEPSLSQLSRSPRPAAHLAGAARVLPPIGGTDGGAASCPAWLKELKSKKRLSQYDGEA